MTKQAAVLMLLTTACTTTQSAQRPTSQLPQGLNRCTQALAEPLPDGDAPRCAADDMVCLETAKIVAECQQALAAESKEKGFKGALLFGLNSDDSGNVTDVCFYGGSLGEVPNTLACVADKARAKRFNIAPEAQEWKWAVRYSVE
ncbi:MAG: hypothetical protein JNK82_14705 [Myxococcaceae bacterium]|nr:hypothetical protein [Myxococcaceae bacterium]